MEFAAALVTHPACALHDPGWGHPEHPGRLRAIADALRREGPILLGRLLQRGADPAGEEPLRLVHTEEHVARVRRAAARAAEEGAPVHLDPDTPVSGASWEAALAAVGYDDYLTVELPLYPHYPDQMVFDASHHLDRIIAGE